MTDRLSGKELSDEIREGVARTAAELREGGTTPTLAILLATEDEGSKWYTRSIAKAAEKVGIESRLETLSPTASEAEVCAKVEELGGDPGVHAMILQTPLPEGVRVEAAAELIPPGKDVDGMTAANLGRLVGGRGGFAPATAEAVMRLLRWRGVELAGARAVVLGRSTVVGKPVAQLLLAEDATVTVCHSKTRSIEKIAAEADVLVAAVGRARFVTAEFVRPGAVVIDVGTNAGEDGSLVGDVDADSVEGKAGALTPVPGGVGLVTTACLLAHAVEAAQAQAA